ncbi:HdeD family acid-resistance protein [Novosphingobium sp.]|uniref:HdeD family acid-resistance protein n=1 Tax=Novosphingobium sp. TaxID=1874826 RepID=UPI002FE06FCD
MNPTNMDPILEPRVENDPLVQSLAQASGKAWGWVLAYGILLLLIALVVIANPLVAGVATGLLIGVVLVIYGIAAIAAGWTSLSQRARWVEVLLGLLALVAGIFAILNPVAGALSLVWAIGAWLTVSGGFQIAFALKARHDRGWRLFLGVLDVVLGLILLFSNPATGLAFLAVIIMISLVVRGVFLILLANTLRKLSQ